MHTRRLIFRYVLTISLFVGTLSFAFWISALVKASQSVSDLVSGYGYLGIAIFSFLNGFNVAVPIPTASFMPAFLAAGLGFWTSIFIMSLGMTLADSASYFVGKSGRALFSGFRTHLKEIDAIRKKHPSWPFIFLALYGTFAPLPNELIILPMSFLGYRLRYIFPIVFLGNFLFNVLFALGVIQLFSFF